MRISYSRLSLSLALPLSLSLFLSLAEAHSHLAAAAREGSNADARKRVTERGEGNLPTFLRFYALKTKDPLLATNREREMLEGIFLFPHYPFQS